jgi:hypothetical protein
VPSTLPDWDDSKGKTLGWHITEWAEEFLIQPDGPNAGEPWRWSEPQLNFVLWFYAVDDDLRLKFRRAAQRWSKGRGKSPEAAALSLIELCGPVVPDYIGDCGRDCEVRHGFAHGRPHAMPWVQIAATAEDQTVNTMAMILGMCAPGSKLVTKYGLDVGKTIIYRPGGGRLHVITSSARAAEGGRPTFVNLDEVQEWQQANGGHALAYAIRRNLAKTGGRSLETGNAHEPGLDSVSERTLEAWQAQQEGRTRGDGILMDCTESPADTDMADYDSLKAGLAEAYKGADWIDLDRLIGEIWDPDTPPDVARRYYLNQVTASDDAWCAPHEIKALADPEHVVPDGAPIVLFFDGSKSDDATGLVGCEMKTGHVFVLGAWEPHGSGGDVPVAEVDRAVDAAFERYEVIAFFADVREWEQSVKVAWPERHGAGLLVHAVPGGKSPEPIAWDMRTKVFDFTTACELTLAEIQERSFTHDGDSRLVRHVVNAHRRPNRYGVSIGKESRMSARKIDLAVCMIGARMVRRIAMSDQKWQRRLRRLARAGKGRAVVLS